MLPFGNVNEPKSPVHSPDNKISNPQPSNWDSDPHRELAQPSESFWKRTEAVMGLLQLQQPAEEELLPSLKPKPPRLAAAQTPRSLQQEQSLPLVHRSHLGEVCSTSHL